MCMRFPKFRLSWLVCYQGLLAASVFGRDEDDGVMELRQRDVDEIALGMLKNLDGTFQSGLRTPLRSQTLLDIRYACPHRVHGGIR